MSPSLLLAKLPSSAEVIQIFRKATDSNRQQPDRVGNIVLLERPGEQVLVTGDLHGHRQNFARILELADLEQQPSRHLILQEVCHGGPLDPSGEACFSHRMLMAVAELITKYPDRVHYLLSNHELAEATGYPIIKNQRPLNQLFMAGIRRDFADQADNVHRALRDFVVSCPLAVRVAPHVFVCHTVPDGVDARPFDDSIFYRPWAATDLVEGGPVFRQVWGRDFRPANAEAFARMVDADLLIHGHQPCLHGYEQPNARQIILDCCKSPASVLMLDVGQPIHPGSVTQRVTSLTTS